MHTSTGLAYLACPNLNYSNRPVRTRMPGGVAGVQQTFAAPYADLRYLIKGRARNRQGWE